MTHIFESTYFTIETRNPPHIDRLDGGHIIVAPKRDVENITQLTPPEAKEFIKIVMVAGEAMTNIMKKQGIELGKINYQMNANFNSSLHMHLYGRALNSHVQQKYGKTIQFAESREGFFKKISTLAPLTEEDLNLIRKEIEFLLKTEKYMNFDTQ